MIERNPLLLILLVSAGALLARAEAVRAAGEGLPEQEALRLSRLLQPIPDSKWREIAGPRTEEKYEIVKGDTLYDISKRLFGDPKYWPKIWAINNGSIVNPHLIYPGNKISFLPGTGTSLPTLGIETGGDGGKALAANGDAAATGGAAGASPGAGPAAAPDGSPDTEARAAIPEGADPELFEDETGPGGRRNSDRLASSLSGRSQEWRKLPRQSWELVEIAPPIEVDPQGFDRRSKLTFSKGVGIDLGVRVSSEPVNTIGEILGARTSFVNFFTTDVVFIRASDELQVGETYGVVGQPSILSAPESGRKVYNYVIRGGVKIIGIKDGVYIGSIAKASNLIRRGDMLIHYPAAFKGDTPIIPAASPVEGTLLVDREVLSANLTGQFKLVFFDRGSDDGVRPGMVFRLYQHTDPVNKRKLTDADFVVSGDVMITQISERASAGIVLRSVVELEEFARGVLLTDVSDLTEQRGVREKVLGSRKGGELDSVDQLDISGGLGKKEAEELRQLERWQGNDPSLQKPEGDAKVTTPAAPGGETPPADFEAPPTADPGTGAGADAGAGGGGGDDRALLDQLDATSSPPSGATPAAGAPSPGAAPVDSAAQPSPSDATTASSGGEPTPPAPPAPDSGNAPAQPGAGSSAELDNLLDQGQGAPPADPAAQPPSAGAEVAPPSAGAAEPAAEAPAGNAPAANSGAGVPDDAGALDNLLNQ